MADYLNHEFEIARNLEGRHGSPGGGPYIILRFAVWGDRVISTDFECNGCPAAQMASAGVATFAKGRSLDQLSRLDSNDLLTLIGGLPEGKEQYAGMAIEALRGLLGERNVL